MIDSDFKVICLAIAIGAAFVGVFFGSIAGVRKVWLRSRDRRALRKQARRLREF